MKIWESTPPAYRLPYDILCTIFQLYVDDILAEHRDRPVPPRKYQGPLLVSQICQYWRQVAFSTPTLWSTLTVEHGVPSALVSHFLTLARQTPLRLYIALWTYDGDAPDPKVLDLLLSYAHRWRSVHIWFDDDTATELLRRFHQNGNIPKGAGASDVGDGQPWILEEAIIEGGFCVPAGTSRKLWSFFLDRNRFPFLTRFHWSLDLDFLPCTSYNNSGSGVEAGDSESGDMNCQGLTHLTLTSPPPMAGCLLLLRRCVNLQVFRIEFRNTVNFYLGCHVSESLEKPIIPPSSLRSLVIRVDKLAMCEAMNRYTSCYLESSDSIVLVCV